MFKNYTRNLLWKVNFSSKRNCLDGSIFPEVPFLLVQFIDLITPLAQSSFNSKGPLFSFNNVGLFDDTTPLPIAIAMRRLIAVPAARVPITFSRNHLKLSLVALSFLKIVFPSFSFFILNLQLLIVVITKVYFGYTLLNRSSVTLVPLSSAYFPDSLLISSGTILL